MATEKVSTIKSSGGDYTTLTAWEADLGAAGGVTSADLVTNDEIAVAEIYYSFSDNAIIDSFTSDTTRFPLVRPAAGLEHNGVIASALTITGYVYMKCNGSTIQDFKVLANSTTGGINTITSSLGAGDVINIRRMIVDGNSGWYKCIIYDPDTTHYILNSLFIDGNRCISESSTGSNCFFYNNTVINCGQFAVARVVTKNCFVYDNGGASNQIYLPAAGSTNNASSDSTGSAGLQNLTSAEFNNYAGGDYSLASDSNLIDAGADLSGTFTTDIAGNTRS